MESPEFLTPRQAPLGVLVWRLPIDSVALSSATVGGGLSRPKWIVNVRVPHDYSRTDVHDHVEEVAQGTRLDGDGIGLLTAADVSHFGVGQERGVRVEATAGISNPTWAAAADDPGVSVSPGTINVVLRVPMKLEVAAAVNAVITVTEAKTQALIERGVLGTGTATDTVTVVWESTGDPSVEFCGPRSPWGAAIARATHAAVGDAIDTGAASPSIL